jgi:hypothetical protein
VPGADHLAAIKIANQEVIELALETFRKAESPPLLPAAGGEAGRRGPG